ncbi:primase-helicase family protein [Polaribacter marinaquae]|uniref:Primase-helicase family protein n=1 Tax=Polaribacter marinaquae TaxID=1642819 RepID=A0ABZ2TTN9_9FLAO
MNKKENPFWENEEGKLKISNSELLNFLGANGFVRLKLSPTNYLLVKKKDNRIRLSSEEEMIAFVGDYLIRENQEKVYEAFVKSVGQYISTKKLSFLEVNELPDDRDSKDTGIFYFKNCYCLVYKEGVEVKDYSELPYVIWKNRLINCDYSKRETSNIGQFEQFCKNITNNEDSRFLTLKTILGYLLHRNKSRGEDKVIILYDENMLLNDKTNGGTGKTLLSDALSKVRELELFDGKSIKGDSWFKNQRIGLTTDIITYDDLNKNISLEMFYSMITSGIEVEKKRKDAFFIKKEESPKIIITSNYPVKGPGGSSDKRRRFEFEVANYYDEEFTPEVEFGNRFFNEDWGINEWQKFYHFLMECLNDYLNYGLVKAPSINYKKKSLEIKTSADFVEFADSFIEYNQWMDKRVTEELFNDFFPNQRTSSHQFKKFLSEYSVENDATLELKSTGGKYLFKMIKKEKDDEESSL